MVPIFFSYPSAVHKNSASTRPCLWWQAALSPFGSNILSFGGPLHHAILSWRTWGRRIGESGKGELGSTKSYILGSKVQRQEMIFRFQVFCLSKIASLCSGSSLCSASISWTLSNQFSESCSRKSGTNAFLSGHRACWQKLLEMQSVLSIHIPFLVDLTSRIWENVSTNLWLEN